MPALAEFIKGSIWARDLTPGQLERARAQTVERAVPAGGYACRKVGPVEYWIGVVEGLLKLSIVSPEGKAATLTGVPAGGWFGEGSLLRTEPRRYDAVALRVLESTGLLKTEYDGITVLDVEGLGRFGT